MMDGKGLVVILFLVLNVFCLKAQKGVTTQHNDLNRTGWNNHETILNKKNVKPASFGKMIERSVDDQIYAQPLVLMNVNIPVAGAKNIVFVATVNNTVYAFDADSANVVTPYWQVNLTPAGSRAVKAADMTGACGGGYRDFSGNMGIVGTPVLDTVTHTLYVVARSVTINTPLNFKQYLHALDITTGAERPNSPKLITAQVNGTGDGSVAGKVNFDAQKQNQRPGLLLLNGYIYIAWASHCDWGPYHGWIMGYDKTTLQQETVYNSTPDGYNGGIWMSGAAPAADEFGNIYAAVGNGSVGVGTNLSDLRNRSESALKLVPSGSTLTVSSFFSPNNIPELEAADLDFGVTEVLLIPGTNRAMTGCKDGNLYLLDRDNMGGYNASANNVVQTINLGTNSHLRSSLAYYKGQQKEYVYSWSENAALKAFPYNAGTNKFDLNLTVSSGVQGPVGSNGALLAVSSNLSVDSTAILWASHAASGDANQSTRPGILRAFDASDVTKELWNSAQYPSDNPGNYAKFNCPTVFNGKVYLATFSNKLVVYGLVKGVVDTCSAVNIGLNKPAVSSSVESGSVSAQAAFDGNLSTRWGSQFSDPQSIYVDLGKRHDLCKVVLKWEAALGKDFKIQVSDDAVFWTTLVNISGNQASENYLPVSGTGRYVRMLGTARGTQYGYSLYEFEVYGMETSAQCADPVGLNASDIYENSATLNWNSGGATSFVVEYKTVSASGWLQTTTTIGQLNLTGLACGTDYLFRARAICSSADSSNYSIPASFSTLSCNSNCSPLPTRWTTLDVGVVDVAGSACFNNDIFELHGSGQDIWDTEDAFRFAFKTFVGDGEIKARVASLDQSDPWNKCGIMFRESLEAGSRHTFVALTSGNGVAFQNRMETGGTSNNVNEPGPVAPYWLKLVKRGTVYWAFKSSDGLEWSAVGDSVDANFGDSAPVYAGLALTSHNITVLSTATVDNYELTANPPGVDLTASLTVNKTVALQWVATLESNIQSFVVERSKDNVQYSSLDTVPAVNNGKYTQTYKDEDAHPDEGTNYYRLRIIYLDGSVTYSAIVFVRVSESDAPSLYPNPTTQGSVRIEQGEETITQISIYDFSGRSINRFVNSPNYVTIDIPVSTLPNGMYIVEIKTATTVYREKLLVQN